MNWRGGSFVAAAIFGMILSAGSANATSSCGANQDNLVQNCGFETGNLTGWTVDPDFAYLVFNGVGYGGGYGLVFDGIGSTFPLSQTLNTSDGTTYSISFLLYGNDVYPDEISLSWSGIQIFDLVNIPPGWQQYTFTETATSDSTELSFGLRDDNTADVLDEISVTPTGVPEPSSLAVLGASLLGFRLIRLRPRQL